MVGVMVPAGGAIAGFVMTVISWYGMLRTGVQLVHDDLASRTTVTEDILNMLSDLEHQEDSLRDWKREWHISDHTPDEILKQIWGEARFQMIDQKLRFMKANTKRARDNLGPLGNMADGAQGRMGRWKRRYYATKFIWTKKKYVRDLLNGWLNDMRVIKEASSAGWLRQKQHLNRSIPNVTPYHTQVAYLLVKIALQNHSDADNLHTCCDIVKDEVSILLDLDVFDALTAVTENEHAENITQAFGVGHLKLEMLLHETERQQGELTRVSVETASGGVAPESRVIDAFRAVLGPARGEGEASKHHFSAGPSTPFCVTKSQRTTTRCSVLRQTFRDLLADGNPPDYNTHTKRLVRSDLIFGDLSHSKAAFELTQVCLLFFRTTWLTGLCRCGLRYGLPLSVPTVTYHQFGLEIVGIEHKPPAWPNPDSPGTYLTGSHDQSWCITDFRWSGLNKLVRQLGLLLVEISLGTVVFPRIDDSINDGTAPITGIYVSCRNEEGNQDWVNMTSNAVTRFVKRGSNDSDHIARAIEYCLTKQLPASPSDAEWEKTLKHFYFIVVAPFRDLYDLRLKSGLL